MKLIAIPALAMLAIAFAACGGGTVDESEEGATETVDQTEQAAISRESIITYYSNASKTVVVGFRENYCGGQYSIEGQVTNYRTTEWGMYCSNHACCTPTGQPCPEWCFSCELC